MSKMMNDNIGWHMPTPLERRIGLIALGGITAMFVGSLVAAVAYQRPDGLSYSFLNQFISNLGVAKFSPLAKVFNGGMMIGGTLMAIAMILFAIRTRTKGVYLATVFGVPGVLGIALIGVFPGDSPIRGAHMVAAAMAFIGAFGYSVITTGLLMASSSLRMPRWLSVPSVGPAIAVIAFLTSASLYSDVPRVHGHNAIESSPAPPTVWPPALFEWSILVAFILWIFFAASWLAFARRAPEHATH